MSKQDTSTVRAKEHSGESLQGAPFEVRLAIIVVMLVNVVCYLFHAVASTFECDVFLVSAAIDLLILLLFVACYQPFELFKLKAWASAGFFGYWFYCLDKIQISVISMLAWIMIASLGVRMPRAIFFIFVIIALALSLLWNFYIYGYGF